MKKIYAQSLDNTSPPPRRNNVWTWFFCQSRSVGPRVQFQAWKRVSCIEINRAEWKNWNVCLCCWFIPKRSLQKQEPRGTIHGLEKNRTYFEVIRAILVNLDPLGAIWNIKTHTPQKTGNPRKRSSIRETLNNKIKKRNEKKKKKKTIMRIGHQFWWFLGFILMRIVSKIS